MNRPEPAVFTNMCMVYDHQGRVLVQNRRDPNWSGITFPGGHTEPGESFAASVIREVWEETGLEIRHPRLCGVKQFRSAEGARFVVLLYKTDEFSGVLKGSEEGDVFWLERSEVEKRPMTPDFPEMLRVFERDDLSELYYSPDGNGEERMFF